MDATRAPNFDQARFSADVIERGTTTIVEFAGELDVAARSRALHVLANAIDRAGECVVLDLARLTFMDSAGIHLAVGASAQAERRGVRFVIIPGPRQIRAVFELCGLHDALPFVGWSQTTDVRGVAGPA